MVVQHQEHSGQLVKNQYEWWCAEQEKNRQKYYGVYRHLCGVVPLGSRHIKGGICMVDRMHVPKGANSVKKPVNPVACELNQHDYKRERHNWGQPLIEAGVRKI